MIRSTRILTTTCTDPHRNLALEEALLTSLPEDQAMLVATGLTGMAQTAARFCLRQPSRVPRDQASHILSVLAWRGVSGFPKTDAKH